MMLAGVAEQVAGYLCHLHEMYNDQSLPDASYIFIFSTKPKLRAYRIERSNSHIMISTHLRLWVLAFMLASIASCKIPSADDLASDDPALSNPDWTAESHSNDAAPNYDVVFPQDAVNSIEITMTQADWTAIKGDMITKSWGTFGQGSQGGQGGNAGGGGGSFGEDPEYVAVTMKFNGKTWNKAGFRLKGNSSLSSIWRAGGYKLPFRLNFDKYEDDFPAIKNQRFYGFKELSMSPGFSDNTLLREKVVADIFRAGGISAARTAYYKVYINYGAGLKYCGIYTAVEVIDDTMVDDQIDSDGGNVYKPESYFKTFATAEFEKKSNEKAADYTDVQSFITALNSNIRISNSAQWRANLEKTFDVDYFLKYLAINNTIVNWDCYGSKAHNHYLYNSPVNKLMWIPWDFNMAMASTSSGGAGGGMSAVSLGMTEVTTTWPLLRYIADDPVYYGVYKTYVRAFKENVFVPAKMDALFDKYHNLIKPYVNGTETEQVNYTNLTSLSAFDTDLTTLKSHVVSRNAAVVTFLK
jgi:spore coat protein H